MRANRKYALSALGVLAIAPMIAEIASRSAPGPEDRLEQPQSAPANDSAAPSPAAASSPAAPMKYSPIPQPGDEAMATGGMDPRPMLDPAAPTATTFNTAPTMSPPVDEAPQAQPPAVSTPAPASATVAPETPKVVVRQSY